MTATGGGRGMAAGEGVMMGQSDWPPEIFSQCAPTGESAVHADKFLPPGLDQL